MSNKKNKIVTLSGLAAISLIFWGLYLFLWNNSSGLRPADELEVLAARLMAEGRENLLRCQKEKGLVPEKNPFDFNQTGLIGQEDSPITTTLGNLQAKRTTTNPNLAALLVYLLKKAGVRKGQAVALGASSSFPALILATYSAARVMELNLLVIVSLGSSQWGANNPEFSWLEMETCLRSAGFNHHRLLALSFGGEDDSGGDFPDDFKNKVINFCREFDLMLLGGGSLEQRVQEHLSLFLKASGSRRISAFINVGGSAVNLGSDSSILELRPGLTRVKKIPKPAHRGLIQEMALREVPIIHLLNIRKLVEIYGLPWDPKPLPQPGEGLAWPEKKLEKRKLIFLFLGYVLTGLFWLVANLFIQKRDGQLELRTGS
jgi:poly-gamma-glutamate system protein